MKKLLVSVLLCLISISVFAEKITLRAGDTLAISLTDYFFPVDITVTGSKCSVTSIKNVDDDLWCISIVACKNGATSIPIPYEYYVEIGDIINLRRVNEPMKECNLKVESITWNEAVLDIQ